MKFVSRYVNLTGVDPEAALETLEDIRERHEGCLRPADLVRESRQKSATFHTCFEWKDAIAGQRYREWQARQIIRAVRVEIIDEEGKSRDEPAFVPVRITRIDDNGHSRSDSFYQSTQVAIERIDQWVSAVDIFAKKIDECKKALADLERVANRSEQPDRAAWVHVANKALTAALEAIRH